MARQHKYSTKNHKKAPHQGLNTDGLGMGTKENYGADELEFMQAIEKFKRENKRPFPTWSEILEIAKGLGYRKDKP